MRKKKAKLMASDKQKQWLMDRIMESPESCAKMKAIIENDLDRMLRGERPCNTQDIKAANNFLKLASVVEEIFKVDKNIDPKKLLEYVETIKKYGSLDDKPKLEAKHKTEFKV